MREGSFTVFVRDFQGRSICLSLEPSHTVQDLKYQLQARTGIPAQQQILTGRKFLEEQGSLKDSGVDANSELQLTAWLRGGKGGFGSLLRGSAKGTQTENEDACRDLSGRRLRIVNAEKKLQEWQAAERQRRLEKHAAREERKKERADLKAEKTQEELDVIRSQEAAALSSMAKALSSSRKHAEKRSNEAQPSRPPKRSKFDSDSESEDSDDDSDAEELIPAVQTEKAEDVDKKAKLDDEGGSVDNSEKVVQRRSGVSLPQAAGAVSANQIEVQ